MVTSFLPFFWDSLNSNNGFSSSFRSYSYKWMGKVNGKFICIHFMLVSWQKKRSSKSLNLWKAIVHESLCHEMGFCDLLCLYIRAHTSCFEANFYDQYFHFCWELALDTWVKDFLINSLGIHSPTANAPPDWKLLTALEMEPPQRQRSSFYACGY